MTTKKRKALSVATRFRVLERYDFTCQYCGHEAPEVKLHVDHIVPLEAGGSDEEWNMTAACVDCNLGKKARPLRENCHPLAEVENLVRDALPQIEKRAERKLRQAERFYAEAWELLHGSSELMHRLGADQSAQCEAWRLITGLIAHGAEDGFVVRLNLERPDGTQL